MDTSRGVMRRRRVWRVRLTLVALCGAVVTTVVTEVGAGASNRSVIIAPAATVPSSDHYLGAVPGAESLSIDIAVNPAQPSALRAEMAAVTSPRSPEFHHYLKTSAFAARFGAPSSELSSLRRFIRSEGLTWKGVSGDRLIVSVTGSARRLEQAFATRLGRFATASANAIANTAPIHVPATIAPYVASVVGLDNLVVSQPQVQSQTDVTTPPEPAASCANEAQPPGKPNEQSASEIADAYGFNGLYSGGDFGQGESVGVIEFAPYIPADITTFDACYGVSPPLTACAVYSAPSTCSTTQVAGSPNSDGSVEADLDIEDLDALVPNMASLTSYESSNSSTGLIDAYTAAIDADVDVLSTSWGMCETEALGAGALVAAEKVLFEQAVTDGTTVVAASGDYGSTGCLDGQGQSTGTLAVDDPASQPDVLGVGGTDSPTAQIAWNTGSLASGGGVSSYWSQPSYQQAAITKADVDTTCAPPDGGNCRAVPDVAADAGAGLEIYTSSYPYQSTPGWYAYGGTSLGAPTWAALIALADASPACAANADPKLGFVNPALYAIAGDTPEYASAFNDVTIGDNSIDGYSGYSAGDGFDLTTGLGSPIAGNGIAGGTGLVSELCGDTAVDRAASPIEVPASPTTTTTTLPTTTTTTTIAVTTTTTTPPPTTTSTVPPPTTSIAPATTTPTTLPVTRSPAVAGVTEHGPAPKVSSPTARTAVANHTVKVVLACRSATCKGSAALTETVKTTVLRKGKKVVKTTTRTLGSVSYSLKSGHHETVAIKLNATGRSVLSHVAHTSRTLTLHVTASGGTTYHRSVVIT